MENKTTEVPRVVRMLVGPFVGRSFGVWSLKPGMEGNRPAASPLPPPPQIWWSVRKGSVLQSESGCSCSLRLAYPVSHLVLGRVLRLMFLEPMQSWSFLCCYLFITCLLPTLLKATFAAHHAEPGFGILPIGALLGCFRDVPWVVCWELFESVLVG
jgi:hypothetical protein